MSNVVDITTKFHEAPPIVDDTPRSWARECDHKHTSIDTVLRTVGCRDCGEERLDPIEVLISLCRQWDRWRYEAEQLTKLRTEQREHEAGVWTRARDRHLDANPDHSIDLTRHGWTASDITCRICYRLETNCPYWLRPPAPATPPEPTTDAPEPNPARPLEPESGS